jgi:hypothetical protein
MKSLNICMKSKLGIVVRRMRAGILYTESELLHYQNSLILPSYLLFCENGST